MKLIHRKIRDAKSNPLLEGLPDELKEPDNFKQIESQIIRTMVSDHKHATIKQFLKCPRCQAKIKKREAKIKELGFKDVEQYHHWKKIMSIIINKKDLKLYEKN